MIAILLKFQKLFVAIRLSWFFEKWGLLVLFIRKSNDWISQKPTEFTILGLFYTIQVTMATIEILRLT